MSRTVRVAAGQPVFARMGPAPATSRSATAGYGCMVSVLPTACARRGCFALLILLLLTAAPVAHADELVQVAPVRSSGSVQPSGQPLFGFLARPYRAGRFPAVVLLHGCGGFGEHDVAAAARVRSWGYVALALDSLGGENHCGRFGGALAEAFDAYAALRFLAAQDFVQPGNIAVMGYSMGGVATLEDVEHGLSHVLARGQPGRFRAAIAYYPGCRASTGDFAVPLLMLIGKRDDWASAEACRRMVAHHDSIGITRQETGAPVTLVVYPHATHAFDYDEPPRHYLGHFMRYDPVAAQDAERQVRAFLHANLVATDAGPPAPSAAPQGGH